MDNYRSSAGEWEERLLFASAEGAARARGRSETGSGSGSGSGHLNGARSRYCGRNGVMMDEGGYDADADGEGGWERVGEGSCTEGEGDNSEKEGESEEDSEEEGYVMIVRLGEGVADVRVAGRTVSG